MSEIDFIGRYAGAGPHVVRAGIAKRRDSGPRRCGEGRKVVRYVSSQTNSGHSQPPTAASGTRGRPFTVLLIAST